MKGGQTDPPGKTTLKKPSLIRVKKHKINIRKEVQVKFVVTDNTTEDKYESSHHKDKGSGIFELKNLAKNRVTDYDFIKSS